MSTNFVHLVCLFLSVFCLAFLHQAHSMTVFTNATLDEPMNVTEVNVVNGDQILSKKRESWVAPIEPETIRDPRMTVIENQVVHGRQRFRFRRETTSKDDKTLDRRATNIETSNVHVNQIMFKKRETPVAMTEPETVHDRRMTIIEGPLFERVPVVPSEIASSNPIHPDFRGDFRPSQAFALPQSSANRMIDQTRPVASSNVTEGQSTTVPLASMADPNAQPTPLSATPNFVDKMTVNGNQFLSKK